MAPWIDTALKVTMTVLFSGFAIGMIWLIASDGRPRFPGWKFPRSKEQVKVEKALDKAIRRAGGLSPDERARMKTNVNELANDMLDFENDPTGLLSGVPAAIDRVKADDGPLTVDTVLLSPGEVAVFDASGALVVWFPAPGSDVGSVVCQKSVTILTYADMPQATPRMRNQLRLLKGGRHE